VLLNKSFLVKLPYHFIFADCLMLFLAIKSNNHQEINPFAKEAQ
jgi:hypothetical protein